MGVTIGNKNRSIDMGYGGFYNLRCTVAGLLSKELGKLYKDWCHPVSSLTDEEGNKLLAKLEEKGEFAKEDYPVLDFLFASDTGGKVSAKDCRRLYNVIKDHDDNICYGYAGHKDCAKFKDFKEIVEDCARNRLVLSWS
jgi:hypothetical protein